LSVTSIDGPTLKRMFLHAASVLEQNKETVNALNVFPVPDGDTGSNMSMTIASASREVDRARDRTVTEVAAAIAQGSLMGARGNSGVILSQLYRGFAKHCDGVATLDAKELAKALQAGVDTAYKAVMKPVEGTILTVARESAAAALTAARRNKEIAAVLRAAYEEAELSLERTPDLLPVLKKAGVVDAGGKGLTLILRGYLEVIQGAPVEEGSVRAALPNPAPAAAHEPSARHDASPATKIAFRVDEEISHIEFPYDTELFIRRHRGGPPIPSEQVAEVLQTMGDSVYVVGDENLAKVHIHAKNPGPVLDFCIKFGDLIDIVIHNMREQHEHLLEHAEQTEPAAPAAAEWDEGTGVVAVGAGPGIEEILRSIGVSCIIHGGQTMNPSTQDLLEAINACRSREVFILPNNKNIILAAEQAATLTDRKVHVIPSRSVPQGIAAMLKWAPDEDSDKLAQEMKKALAEVETGEITFSVRDTVFGDMRIREGDILGLWNGQITATGASPETVLREVLARMVQEKGGDVITVYWGEGVDEERAGALGDELRGLYPGHDVEVLYGGQPLYFYLFSLE
jgi:uncharacterized protein